jgi:hypothetical protein
VRMGKVESSEGLSDGRVNARTTKANSHTVLGLLGNRTTGGCRGHLVRGSGRAILFTRRIGPGTQGPIANFEVPGRRPPPARKKAKVG